ncbi:hypothetical protein DPMN_063467 [Dreissena polymorpha]|uniref:Uncharacterized protein n=1 Tax=Dreissena polymorpha TaxID=45954 RepID=A0A9D4CBR2_DREPO|nr:hypothetical protein DPMN_062989 [Dreissena polymorpha]KAH3720568.1 hypothetical protein DPMN_063467 [Dreissena polymorpha]
MSCNISLSAAAECALAIWEKVLFCFLITSAARKTSLTFPALFLLHAAVNSGHSCLRASPISRVQSQEIPKEVPPNSL